MNLKHITGARYLGSFIGNDEALEAWLKPKISKWQSQVDELTVVAACFPQMAYAGMVKSL